MLATVVSVALSTRFVFKVASSVTLLKMLALRSIIKVVVGLLFGVLLSIVLAAMHNPSLTTAVGLFVVTCVVGSVAGLFIYKLTLAKILNLQFSLKQFIAAYFAEVTITAILSAIAVSLLIVLSEQ